MPSTLHDSVLALTDEGGHRREEQRAQKYLRHRLLAARLAALPVLRCACRHRCRGRGPPAAGCHRQQELLLLLRCRLGHRALLLLQQRMLLRVMLAAELARQVPPHELQAAEQAAQHNEEGLHEGKRQRGLPRFSWP